MASSPSGSLVSADVRRHNLALVAHRLAQQGPLSRSQLADVTGLARGSVTALVAALVEAGVVRESEEPEAAPRGSASRGRPLTLLRLAADDVALLVLQLDADQATAVLTAVDGRALFRASEHHGRPMGDPGRVLDVLARVLARTLDAAAGLGRRVVDLTVVVFAPIGGTPPVLVADTDFEWGEVDVLGGLRQRVPELPPATLASDGTVAALAELAELEAAGSGVRDLVYAKSNSGIGGAVVAEGALVAGAHEFAGAFGHIAVDPRGPRCLCGQRGCLVTVAGPDVVLAAAGLTAEVAERGLTEALRELVARINAGEPAASAAWEAALPWIAHALRIVSMTVDPEVVVLGGYWAELAGSIAEAFAQNGPAIASTATAIAVVPGRLGEDAALIGAARVARGALLDDPLALATVHPTSVTI
ncbi:putative NBD/HSP70 family sugar kinase [Leifsonia sp. EB41]|uniref:ROK family protein n=1 Tax=Leifsonia sp. EB41 TaxID=3156260 RepID=UPI00351151EA